MAQRRADKTRRKPVGSARGAALPRSAPKISGGSTKLAARLAAAERERDELRAALQDANARTRKLEEANAAARDRIAWALDTLRSIVGDKG